MQSSHDLMLLGRHLCLANGTEIPSDSLNDRQLPCAEGEI